MTLTDDIVFELDEADLDELKQKRRFADTLVEQHQYAEASKIYDKILMILMDSLGPDNNQTLITVHCYAILQNLSGDIEGSESTFRLVLEGFRRTTGDGSLETMVVYSNIASLLLKQSRFTEAIEVLKVLIAQDTENISNLIQLGDAYVGNEDWTEAIVCFKQVLFPLCVCLSVFVFPCLFNLHVSQYISLVRYSFYIVS